MKILKTWAGFRPDQRKIFIFCSLSFVFCLGSYPFIRSLAQSLFIEHVGVENRPFAWMLTIVSLAGVISGFNYLQKKYYVQRLHWIMGILSFVILGGSYLAMENGMNWGAYTFFVWKEIYIVMLVGFVISFCNNFFTHDEAKMLYGPYGAIGSIGAVAGGQMTKYLSNQHQLGYVLIFGLVTIVLSSLLFAKTGKTIGREEEKDKTEVSPLVAVKEVKTYVLFMCLLVASTQFAINSASQIFYIILQNDIPDKFARTAYLGDVFSAINSISLLINLLVMPWLLNLVSARVVHYFIPIFFMISMSFVGGGVPLLIAGGVFVGFKAIDYSLFSVVKELLYFPLNRLQKYGAKYITDVFIYRSAKTVIALLLVKFSTQGDIFIILMGSLGLWLLSVIVIDRYQQKLKRMSS